MVTIAKLDGFEHGVADTTIYDAIVGTPEIITTSPRTGARHLRISKANGAAEWVRYTVSSTIVTIAVYIRFQTSLPAVVTKVLEFFAASNPHYLTFSPTTNQFRIQMSDGTVQAGGPTLVADTWYRVVIEQDSAANPHVVRCTVNNGTEFSKSQAIASRTCTGVMLGTDDTDTSTPNILFDDWITSVTDTDYEAIGGWISHQVERLLPNGDGTHSIVGANEIERTLTGTDIINTTTDAYLLVDDVPLDQVPTDYINDVGTNVNSYAEVVLEDLAATSLLPAAVFAYEVDRDSTGTGTAGAVCRVVLADGTAVAPDLRLAADDPGLTVTTRKKMLTAPTGGWDRTKVNGLKVRMGFGDGAPDAYFGSVLLEAAMYEPSAVNLVIADGAHAHAADNVVLTEIFNLVIAEALHAHAADNVVLTEIFDLLIQEAFHAHVADNVVLTEIFNLLIQEAFHAHTSDNVTLLLPILLVIQDALHTHTADEIGRMLTHMIQAVTRGEWTDRAGPAPRSW